MKIPSKTKKVSTLCNDSYINFTIIVIKSGTDSYVLLGPSGLFAVDPRMDMDSSNDAYGKHKDEMGDEQKDNYEERKASAAASYQTNWPTSIYAYLKLGYDNTLAKQMRDQGTTFETWAAIVR